VGPGLLRDRLNGLLKGRLRTLALTRNRSRVLSVKPVADDPGGLALRLDACFVRAPQEVLQAVVTWIRGGAAGRQALRRLREHFDSAREGAAVAPRPRRRPSPALRPVGRTLDLREVRDRLDRTYFGGKLAVGITWGQAAGGGAVWGERRRRRSIRLGSYSYESKLVRIHPSLDRPDVPRYVVEAVVYHELAHAALPEPACRSGRRRLHPPEFRALERRFPDHERAERWIERHLGSLLRRC
jgi:hypothetical protein